MTRRITIKDLAKQLGLHHSTVSRALRNDPRVQQKTREKVLEIAKSNGYQVNISALKLRGNINNTLALIVPNIRHTFFTNIVSFITNLAFNNNYVVTIFESNENYEQEKEIIKTIIKHNFSGVIASISKSTINSEHFQLLQTYGIPLVFFDRVFKNMNASYVTVDNYQSAFKATELLIKKGYKKIAHITGPIHVNVFKERQYGYIDALSKNKLGYQNLLVINKEFTITDGKIGLDRFIEQNDKPDAILSSSSLLSLGLLVRAKELNYQIPDDLALISYGDNQMSDVLSPGITSIIQPEEEIAQTCFEIITTHLNCDKDHTPIIKEVNTKLIKRQSI